MFRLITAALFAFSLSACSLLPDAGTTESLTVNYLMSKSTTAVIDRGAIQPGQIISAVQDARAYVEDGDTVTIDRLYDGAVERIQGLDPADQILIMAILDNAKARLETAISAGRLDESERVAILDALSWIERAARHATQ